MSRERNNQFDKLLHLMHIKDYLYSNDHTQPHRLTGRNDAIIQFLTDNPDKYNHHVR